MMSQSVKVKTGVTSRKRLLKMIDVHSSATLKRKKKTRRHVRSLASNY